MFDHLRYQGARVEPRSAAGKQADKILMFNDDESVKYREFVLDAIKFAENQKRAVEQTLQIINGRMAEEPSPQLDDEKRTAERDHAKVVEHLSRLGAMNNPEA